MKSRPEKNQTSGCPSRAGMRDGTMPVPTSAVWMATALMLLTAPVSGQQASRATQSSAAPSSVRFAVISDPHLYDTRLGTSGVAFEACLAEDPKLLRESDAILDSAIESILGQDVKFLLVSGDLTKDGELLNHVRMAQHLEKLERRGVQVFVVPGNHDIYNSHAVRYLGDTTRPVAGVSPRMFQAIYQRFGYGQAIQRDETSLSYVAEPARGLWLLAIDTCKYEESKQLGEPVVSGRISPETMVWIQGVMQQAQERGKEVIAFMHHGLNQHFFGEAQLFPDWLLDDWATRSMQLAQMGVRVVFTGHYHSQDAAYLVDETLTPLSPLCDVETASLAAYPCAFRFATLDSQGQLHVESQRVTQIQSDTGGQDFQEYAMNAIFPPTIELATVRIMNMFGLPREQAATVAPLVAQAIIANYAGDEAPSDETKAIIAGLLGSPEPFYTLGMVLQGLWMDLPPNDGTLDLSVSLN